VNAGVLWPCPGLIPTLVVTPRPDQFGMDTASRLGPDDAAARMIAMLARVVR
jgi:hypothetical protein